MKGQMSAAMVEDAASSPHNGLGAFGALLGMALVNQMVETLVRPEVVMRAMQGGHMRQEVESHRAPGARIATEGKPVEWALERRNVDKVIAYRQEQGQAADKDFSLVFERSGFADWKLTEIRLGKLR
jgi:hypothetical protein